MAKLDTIKEAERLDAARRFGEFRQLPLKDAHGLHYTKSAREISPRNALETIVRYFTDSMEQKREQKELSDALRQQVTRAENQYIKARDFSSTVDKILGDYCRAAGVSPRQLAPSLSSQQIAELREFAEKLPCLNTTRTEFTDAARIAIFGAKKLNRATLDRPPMIVHDRRAFRESPARTGSLRAILLNVAELSAEINPCSDRLGSPYRQIRRAHTLRLNTTR